MQNSKVCLPLSSKSKQMKVEVGTKIHFIGSRDTGTVKEITSRFKVVLTVTDCNGVEKKGKRIDVDDINRRISLGYYSILPA